VAVRQVEVDRAVLGLEAYHHHLVGRAAEHLAPVAHLAIAEGGGGDRAVEV